MGDRERRLGPNSLKPEATSRTSLAVIKEGAAKLKARREQKALESLQNSRESTTKGECVEKVAQRQKPLETN